MNVCSNDVCMYDYYKYIIDTSIVIYYIYIYYIYNYIYIYIYIHY